MQIRAVTANEVLNTVPKEIPPFVRKEIVKQNKFLSLQLALRSGRKTICQMITLFTG